MPGPLILLGPQRPSPNLAAALATVPGDGPVVTITAGWRLDEGETDALHAEIGRDAVHIPLYGWFEEAMEGLPDVRARYKQRQRRLMQLKSLYRLRLSNALATVRQLTERLEDDPVLVGAMLDEAILDVRRIDHDLIDRTRGIRAEFPDVAQPWKLPQVAARRLESARLLSSARAVCLAGGHVGVLRNRLHFFGMHQQLFQAWKQDTAVIGWGAGAMVLTDRVVLFYDDPPDGPAHPEIMDTGMAMAHGLVVLPDARKRLRLEDRMRVGLLAGRFGPNAAMAMENGAWLCQAGDQWVQKGTSGSAFTLDPDGELTDVDHVPMVPTC